MVKICSVINGKASDDKKCVKNSTLPSSQLIILQLRLISGENII